MKRLICNACGETISSKIKDKDFIFNGVCFCKECFISTCHVKRLPLKANWTIPMITDDEEKED